MPTRDRRSHRSWPKKRLSCMGILGLLRAFASKQGIFGKLSASLNKQGIGVEVGEEGGKVRGCG